MVSRFSHSSSLQKFRCESRNAADFGLSYIPIPLYNKSEEISEDSPIGKFMQRWYLDEAISHQVIYKNGLQADTEEKELEGRLMSGCHTVQAYEDPKYQAAARAAVDFGQVLKHATEHRTPEDCDQTAFIKGLLRWFKRDFFSWHHRPKCSNPTCNVEGEPPSQVESLGAGPPNEEERVQGWAGRTEISRCVKCNTQLRFPRINNPAMLLKTRSGRCGEFANCFCLICRALGLDARWVMDFSDHVWVEVWIDSKGRYVHADPCEISLDAPLLYEAGWNKKLSYIFSFSRCGVVDSMARYTRKWTRELFERRLLATEAYVKQLVERLDKHMETQHTMRQLNQLAHLGGGINADSGSWLDRAAQGASGFEGLRDCNMDVLLHRKKMDAEELAICLFLKSKELTADEKQGRISGDKTWREQRGELGGEGKGELGNAIPPCDLTKKVGWLTPGILLGKRLLSNAKVLDVFISSIGMDDKMDNASSQLTSNVFDLHYSQSMAPAATSSGVLSHGAVSVNGVPVCAASRGHNVVVLCAFTGALVASRAFDTWGDPSAGQLLVDFLRPFLPPLCVSSVSCATPADAKEQLFTNPMRYILILTVLDSGENAGKAVEDLVKALSYSSSPSHSPFRSATQKVVPGHRESWAMVAVTGSDRLAGCEVLYLDGCEIGKGPCSVRLCIPLLESGLMSALECREINGMEVMGIERVISAADSESREAFTQRILEVCMADQSALGCTVTADGSCGALFSERGFPPLALTTSTQSHTPSAPAVVFAKHLVIPDGGVSAAASVSHEDPLCACYPEVEVIKYIHFNGGGHHGDTTAFDSTIGPLSVRDFVSSCGVGTTTLQLDKISFYGGNCCKVIDISRH